jgi:hypothetical protein
MDKKLISDEYEITKFHSHQSVSYADYKIRTDRNGIPIFLLSYMQFVNRSHKTGRELKE